VVAFQCLFDKRCRHNLLHDVALHEGCSLLENIAIVGYTFLTDKTLIAVGAHCHSLRKVIITDGTYVTHVGLAAVAAGCPLLEELSVSDCSGVGSAMEAVARHCPRLRTLVP
jgi:hypothetical protein